MKFSESLSKLASALHEAQLEMGNVKAESENPMFKSSYVPLNDLLHFAKPILNRHGISIIQSTISEPGQVGARTMLLHSSGEYIETDGATAKVELSTNREGRPTNSYGQAAGSLITYFRRYDGLAALGMAETDNDAQVERHDPIVDPYDAETVRLFATKIQEAMLNKDFTVIGRASIDNQDLFARANTGTRGKKDGYFSAAEKQKFSEYNKQYLEVMDDYVIGLVKADGDKEGTQELLQELTDPTDKRLVWSKLDNTTRQYLESLRPKGE